MSLKDGLHIPFALPGVVRFGTPVRLIRKQEVGLGEYLAEGACGIFVEQGHEADDPDTCWVAFPSNQSEDGENMFITVPKADLVVDLEDQTGRVHLVWAIVRHLGFLTGTWGTYQKGSTRGWALQMSTGELRPFLAGNKMFEGLDIDDPMTTTDGFKVVHIQALKRVGLYYLGDRDGE